MDITVSALTFFPFGLTLDLGVYESHPVSCLASNAGVPGKALVQTCAPVKMPARGPGLHKATPGGHQRRGLRPITADGSASEGDPGRVVRCEHIAQWYLCPTADQFAAEVDHFLEEVEACANEQTLEVDILGMGIKALIFFRSEHHDFNPHERGPTFQQHKAIAVKWIEARPADLRRLHLCSKLKLVFVHDMTQPRWTFMWGRDGDAVQGITTTHMQSGRELLATSNLPDTSEAIQSLQRSLDEAQQLFSMEMDLENYNDDSLHQLWGRRQAAKHAVTIAIRLCHDASLTALITAAVLAVLIMAVRDQATTMAAQDPVSAAHGTTRAVETDVDHVQTLEVPRMATESLETAETARAARAAAKAQVCAVEEICKVNCSVLGIAHAVRLEACFEQISQLDPRDCARFIHTKLLDCETEDAGSLTRLMFGVSIQEYDQYAMEHFGLAADERISAFSHHQLRILNIYQLTRLFLVHPSGVAESVSNATDVWPDILKGLQERAWTPMELPPSAAYRDQVEHNKRIMATECILDIEYVLLSGLWQ